MKHLFTNVDIGIGITTCYTWIIALGEYAP